MAFNLNDIFGLNSTAAPAVPAPAPTPPQVPAPATATPAPTDGSAPFEKSTTSDPIPLDNFSDMFTIDKSNTSAEDEDSAYFTIPSDEELTKGSSHLNFLDATRDAELLQQAAAGDPQALVKMINLAGQRAYVQGAKLSASVAESATRNGVSRVNAKLPEHNRSNLARTQVSELNVAFDHPALKPMVQAARTVLEQKHPNASPREIAEMTNRYMESARDALTKPIPTQTQTPGGNAEIQDFGNFFGQNRR